MNIDDNEIEWDDYGAEPSPICAACGVSMLPPEPPGGDVSCENPDCASFDL